MTPRPPPRPTVHRAYTLTILFVFTTTPLAVAATDTSGTAGSTTASTSNTANQMLTEQFGPFKLSFGEDGSSGGFGANLDGEGRKDFHAIGSGPDVQDVQRTWFPAFGYFTYSATGSWGSAQTATNNASLSFKPGIDGAFAYGKFHDHFNDPGVTPPVTCTDVCRDAKGNIVPPADTPTFYFGTGGSGDLEVRDGTFKQMGNNVSARELLIGAQLYGVALRRNWDFGFGRVLAAPRVSALYYHPITATGTQDVALPSGVKADYIQTEFHTVLGFGGSSTTSYVKLDLKYDGSEPTTGSTRTWQNLYTAKLWMPALKFNGVNPTITYQSGKNGGFSYDKQVLVGVLVEFLDPKK